MTTYTFFIFNRKWKPGSFGSSIPALDVAVKKETVVVVVESTVEAGAAAADWNADREPAAEKATLVVGAAKKETDVVTTVSAAMVWNAAVESADAQVALEAALDDAAKKATVVVVESMAEVGAVAGVWNAAMEPAAESLVGVVKKENDVAIKGTAAVVWNAAVESAGEKGAETKENAAVAMVEDAVVEI